MLFPTFFSEVFQYFFHLTDILLVSPWILLGVTIFVCILLYFLFWNIFAHIDYWGTVKSQFIYAPLKKIKSSFAKNSHRELRLPWLNQGIFKNPYTWYTFLSISISWEIFVTLFFLIHIILFIGLLQIFAPFLAFVILFCILSLSLFFLYSQAQKQKEILIKQLPLFLTALSNALEAGYSLANAFFFIETEIEFPLRKEIHVINQKLRLQIPIEQALNTFDARMNHKDVSFFTESVLIQNRTGGNLVILFKKIAKLIEHRLKIKQDMKAFTSQGKYSGMIIASLWFISLGLFWIMSPGHIEVLFSTSAGQIMLGVSLFLELIGFFFIWRITNIKL